MFEFRRKVELPYRVDLLQYICLFIGGLNQSGT